MKSLLNLRFSMLIVVLFAVALCAGNASCSQRHYPNLTTGLCERCHEKCLTCNGPFEANCSSCIENQRNFNELKGRCVCDGQGNFEDLTTKKCTSCSQMCTSCTGPTNDDCLGCKHGSILRINEFIDRAGTCVCGPTTYHVSNGYCESCDSSCKTCSGPTNQECRECRFKRERMGMDGICTCPSGMTVLNNECKECPDYCSNCIRGASGQLECTKCLPGYEYDSGQKICLCPEGYYSETHLHTCLKCPHTCKRCNATDIGKCIECYNNMNLTDGVCKCNSGTFDEASKSCVSKICQAGEILSGENCKQCITQNCNRCQQDGNVCQTCKEGYTLSYNLCVKECPQGFFKRYNARSDSNTCEICDPSCKTCSGKSNFCTSCKENFILSSNGVCNENKDCGPQKYYSSTNERCMKCSKHCKEDGCTGPGYENCKTCPVSTGRTANGCELCHRLPGFEIKDEVCITKCGDGIKVGDEECDDGNTENNDGCSSSCKIEDGYECLGTKPSKCYKKSEKKSFGYTVQLSNKKLLFKFSDPVGPQNLPVNLYRIQNHKQALEKSTTLNKVNSQEFELSDVARETAVVSFPSFSIIKHQSDDVAIDESCAAVAVSTLIEGEKRDCTSFFYPKKRDLRLLDENEVDFDLSFKEQKVSKNKAQALTFVEKVSFVFAFTVFTVSLLLSFAGMTQAFWSLIWFYQALNLLCWLPISNFQILQTVLQALNPLNFRFATGFISEYLKNLLPAGFIYERTDDSVNGQFQGFILENLAVFAIIILAKMFKSATSRGSLKEHGITTESRVFELGICSTTALALIEFNHFNATPISAVNKFAAAASVLYIAIYILRCYRENSTIKKKIILGFALGAEEQMKKKTSKRWIQYADRMIFAGSVGLLNGSAKNALIGLFVLGLLMIVKQLISGKTSNRLLSAQQSIHRITLLVIIGVIYVNLLMKSQVASELIMSFMIIANSLLAVFVMAYGNIRTPYQALGTK